MPQNLTPDSIRAVPLVQQSIAAASITSSYQLIGQVFGGPVVCLIVLSLLDASVQMSLDGINDWLPMPTSGTLIIDEHTNGIVLDASKALYVKTLGIPTTGSLYVSGFTV